MSGQRSFAMAVAVILIAAPLAAQSVSQNAAPQVTIPALVAPTAEAQAPSAERMAGPTVQTFGVVSRPSTARGATALSPLPADHESESVPMMIVGGAALVAGAVIGGTSGTIIMVGGAGIGLLGLWRYLQ
jgi:hypothetical protein